MCDQCNNEVKNKLFVCLTCCATLCEKCHDETTHSDGRHVFAVLNRPAFDYSFDDLIGNSLLLMNGMNYTSTDAAASGDTHEGVECKHCSMSPIIGTRYQCGHCNYNLCAKCEPIAEHEGKHVFVQLLHPLTSITIPTLPFSQGNQYHGFTSL